MQRRERWTRCTKLDGFVNEEDAQKIGYYMECDSLCEDYAKIGILTASCYFKNFAV